MEKIEDYLMNKRNLDAFSVKMLMESFKRHQDILDEFSKAIESGTYPEDGVKSGEWTAKTLSEKLPHLKDYTIYEFMAGLRDNPEEYAGYIAEGAPYL